jgi:GSCFA family
MYSLNSTEAYEYVHSSPTQIWSTPGDDLHSEDIKSENGGARIFGDLAASGLEYKPKFTLSSSMKIFTLGSCFARNVEVALMAKGFDVCTRTGDFPYPHGGLNRYNTPVMLHELELAIGEKQFQPASIVELPRGFADLTSHDAFATFDKVVEYRAKTTGVFARIKEADAVIITAGLAEVWYDKLYGQFINIAPSQASLHEPDRFQFSILGFQPNLDALRKLINLVHKISPNSKVLLTVSPVPLNATFINRDVLISNAYSKSCLRTAVEEIYWEFDFVDYFPSYELVTLSSPELVWERDRRHVRADFVNKIMDVFIREYVL